MYDKEEGKKGKEEDGWGGWTYIPLKPAADDRPLRYACVRSCQVWACTDLKIGVSLGALCNADHTDETHDQKINRCDGCRSTRSHR